MGLIRTFSVPRGWRDWIVTLPLYDGQQCPRCGSTVIGRDGRKIHLEWHAARDEQARQVRAAIRQLGGEADDDDQEDEDEDQAAEATGYVV